MSRIAIPVSLLEFDEGGNTLWVHSPNGCTVLRVKLAGKFRTSSCGENAVSSHADITIHRDGHPGVHDGDVTFCLAKDAER